MSKERTYPGITSKKLNIIREALGKSGNTVSGDGPWQIEGQFGIILGARWNEDAEELVLTINAKPAFVPAAAVWQRLDSLFEALEKA